MHAIRAVIHSTLGISPGRHTFDRGTFLNTPLISDWNTITQRQEHSMNENLISKNQKNVNTNMSLNKGYLEKNENLAS